MPNEPADTTSRGAKNAGPPYFRLDDPARHTYQAKGHDFLNSITGGNAKELSGSTFVKGLAQVLGEARIIPHDPTQTREELRSLFENLDNDVALNSLLDGAKRRQADFNDFRILTKDWRSHGVGPIRTLYYFTFLGSNFLTEINDPLCIGGFPPSPHIRTQTTYPRLARGHRVGNGVLDWLAYDAFLSDALGHLGVSWLVLEDAMAKAFKKALPKSYQLLLEKYQVPDSLALAFWLHDLEHWQMVQRNGERVIKKLDELLVLISKIRYVEDFGPYLARLRQTAEPAQWTHQVAGTLPVYGKLKPNNPTVRATNTALYDTLASEIGKQSLMNRPAPDAPTFVLPIFEKQAGRGDIRDIRQERQAKEFWMLCTDILHHIPVARGVLNGYFPNTEPRIATFQTENAFRLAVTRAERSIKSSRDKQ